MLKRIRLFILRIARHPHALWGLFAYAVVESVFVPIPPDLLLIALTMGRPLRAQRYAFICMVGSVTGGLIGYAIGRYAFEPLAMPVLEWLCASHASACPDYFLPKMHELFEKHGVWVVGLSAFSPVVPYRFMILAAGLAKMNLVPFIIASVVMHWLRYSVVCWATAKHGQRAVDFIRDRLEWILGLGSVGALVVYLLVQYFKA